MKINKHGDGVDDAIMTHTFIWIVSVATDISMGVFNYQFRYRRVFGCMKAVNGRSNVCSQHAMVMHITQGNVLKRFTDYRAARWARVVLPKLPVAAIARRPTWFGEGCASWMPNV